MNLENKEVLVIGCGKSGVAAANLLNRIGSTVILYDSNDSTDRKRLEQEIIDYKGTEIVLGTFPEEIVGDIDLVVLSPGVPTDLPLIDEMREYNITIWGEIELAFQFAKGKITAITGTNGKTTTTAIVGEILKAYYQSVFVVGNIGTPYTESALDTTEDSVTVAEVSSFQLETIIDFRPEVSVILNITPDHLNRHHTMENYIAAKLKITRNQKEDDICILNYDDLVLREAAARLIPQIYYFSSNEVLENGIYIENGKIIYADSGNKVVVCEISELKLLGRHNYENVMAAVMAGIHMGVPMEQIRRAILNFNAVEHRIEYVTEKNSVKYYNDSKGTNPDAAIKGIEAMVTPTLLIGGGYDKHSEYDKWIKSFGGKVKYLVLIGQTRDKIAETAKKYGFHNIVFADSLEEAVQFCYENAVPGDSVLLSPACASWGMFANYEERGRMFKKIVNKL